MADQPETNQEITSEINALNSRIREMEVPASSDMETGLLDVCKLPGGIFKGHCYF